MNDCLTVSPIVLQLRTAALSGVATVPGGPFLAPQPDGDRDRVGPAGSLPELTLVVQSTGKSRNYWTDFKSACVCLCLCVNVGALCARVSARCHNITPWSLSCPGDPRAVRERERVRGLDLLLRHSEHVLCGPPPRTGCATGRLSGRQRRTIEVRR